MQPDEGGTILSEMISRGGGMYDCCCGGGGGELKVQRMGKGAGVQDLDFIG